MSSGELEMYIYQILFFVVVPVGLPILIYLRKKKILWLSPILVIPVGVLMTFLYNPRTFIDMFSGADWGSNGLFWLIIYTFTWFIISTFVTVMCYIAEWFRKELKRQT